MPKGKIYVDYVKDILNEIDKINRFIKGLTYSKFVKDEKTVYAVIRCFEIMGEAAKNIPVNLRNKYPLVPWKRISGMRDKLIHEYFGPKKRGQATFYENVKTLQRYNVQTLKGGKRYGKSADYRR